MQIFKEKLIEVTAKENTVAHVRIPIYTPTIKKSCTCTDVQVPQYYIAKIDDLIPVRFMTKDKDHYIKTATISTDTDKVVIKIKVTK